MYHVSGFRLATGIMSHNRQRPDGSLTAPDGSPDGSNFCKYFETHNVDGLTGFFAVFSGMRANQNPSVTTSDKIVTTFVTT